jgi:hypothetical protein
MIERNTPRAVMDLYVSLSAEDKSTFLQMLSQQITGDQALFLFEKMPIIESGKVCAELEQRYIGSLYPLMLSAAVKNIMCLPNPNEADLTRMVAMSVAVTHQAMRKAQEAKVKEARDPAKRNVDRDAEIIRLAKEGKTSGEVHLAIKDRWPCSTGAVNQVIIRAKRDGQLPK